MWKKGKIDMFFWKIFQSQVLYTKRFKMKKRFCLKVCYIDSQGDSGKWLEDWAIGKVYVRTQDQN